MTISTNDLREEYTATASQTLFTFDFRVFADTDVTVYQTASGAEFDDSSDIITAYSVSRNANQDSSPGGSITLNTGATVGDRITIVSGIPETRTTDYQTGGEFDPDTVDDDFDRVVSIAKQASAKAGRAVLFPESAQDAQALSMPLPESQQYLRWKSDLLGLENVDLASTGDPADASVITYTPAGTGAVATNVQEKLREGISVTDFGALGDGATDDTAAIQAAIDAAASTAGGVFYSTSGGRDVYIPAGVYAFTSEILVPEFVTLTGDGKTLSVLKATAAAAKLRFGTKSGAFGDSERGGSSGGFTIDGAGVATGDLFHLGFCVERDFHDIDVINSEGNGLLVEAAQNCNFFGCGFQHNGTDTGGTGSNVKLDYGAGNIRFWGCEINRPGSYNVEFKQSGTSPTGAFSVPTDVRFNGCMIERWEDADGTGSLYANGTIYHGAGRHNYFLHCDLSATGLPAALDMVTVRKDGSGASTELYFDSCFFAGTASYSTAFDIDGAVTVVLTGRTFFENHTKVFEVGDDSAVVIEGSILDSSGGTFFTAKGSKAQDQLVFKKHDGYVTKLERAAASSTAQTVAVTGESFARWEWKPNGLSAGPGSGATDVTMVRGSAAGVACWSMLAPLILASGNINVSMQSGSTAGWPAFPNGSLAIKTDGGAGTFLYGRIGGTWTALA